MIPSGEVWHALWAKKSLSGEHHPLLWHMIDVTAVVRLLLEKSLGRGFQDALAKGLSLEREDACQWTSFLAGLHDIGKASPDFQSKAAFFLGALNAAGLTIRPATGQPKPHGTITAVYLERRLHPLDGLEPVTARRLARTLGGHHGVFPSAGECDAARRRMLVNELGIGWNELRDQIAQALREIATPPQNVVPLLHVNDNVTPMLLAGLVTVADWIASDDRLFPFRPDITDPVEYQEIAVIQADEAISALGWAAAPAPPPAAFTELFPRLSSNPRPVQQAVENLLQTGSPPRLMVLEVPTGEGKTEAALLLQDCWRSQFCQRGAYLALPTMATSNQIFSRTADFLVGRVEGPTQLHLLHSQALFSEPYQQLRPGAVGEDGVTGNLVAGDWFMQRKRGLLAPFAVGTVDQALLSVLLVRHGYLRLFGLAHKTAVFDEIHAYDTYMFTLFERMLQWLGRLDVTVAIMSATLPRQRLHELVRSFTGAEADFQPAPYPRITWVNDAGKVLSRSVGASRAWQVKLERHDDCLPRLIDTVTSRLRDGGHAAWICNTVNRAQEVYRALSEVLKGTDVEVNLFHARYPLQQRLEHEQDALVRYGKNRPDEPAKSILVATQVIEQSLDLDFDLMVTELAPADLVLQRAGRLHRHDRRRPGPLCKPTLLLILPALADDGMPATLSSVYEPYVMLRSWLALHDRNRLNIPEDVEPIIESVYGDFNDDSLAQQWRERLQKTRQEAEVNRRKLQMEASRCTISRPTGRDVLNDWNPQLDEDNPDIHSTLRAMTRHGDESVRIICLHADDEGRLSFDEAGAEPFDLGSVPDFSTQKRLIQASVSLSYRGCTRQLPQDMIPPQWSKLPLLRHYRLVRFSNRLFRNDRGRDLRLDPDLGVVFVKKEGLADDVVQSDF